MNKFKNFILLSIILSLLSCGTVREGFSNQKKNNSDEFLVEKKSPLVMPPDFNELPIPRENEDLEKNDESDFRSLIINQENNIIINNNNNKNFDKKLAESLLEKIKKN